MIVWASNGVFDRVHLDGADYFYGLYGRGFRTNQGELLPKEQWCVAFEMAVGHPQPEYVVKHYGGLP